MLTYGKSITGINLINRKKRFDLVSRSTVPSNRMVSINGSEIIGNNAKINYRTRKWKEQITKYWKTWEILQYLCMIVNVVLEVRYDLMLLLKRYSCMVQYVSWLLSVCLLSSVWVKWWEYIDFFKLYFVSLIVLLYFIVF